MTYRSSDSSCKSYYSQPQSRLNQQTKSVLKDEGCQVLEESGSVCGEIDSLNVFLDYKKFYDDCLKKLERTSDGKTTLRKLAPFQRLIDHLWEQNALLIETVGELEEEATHRLSALQDKLNKSCQKINDYQEDIRSLITIIHRFCEKGVLDAEGVEFKTLCPSNVYGPCESSCAEFENNADQAEVPCPGISRNSVFCDNFESSDDALENENRSANHLVKSSKQSGTRMSKNNSGSLKSRLRYKENTSNVHSRSSCFVTKSESNSDCTCKTEECKSVTWEPVKCPKCQSDDENSDDDCCNSEK